MSTPYTSQEPRTQPSSPSGSNGRPAGRKQSTIYLSPTSTEKIDGTLGYLVKLFHLDIHGTNLLTRSVLFELKAISVALAIMFTFDLAAWTFFWNMVLYNGRLAFGLYTPFAIGFGFMFAMIIIIYERQWVVTDISRFGRDWRSAIKILGAFIVRLCIIVLAAYATAQPIEVLFFNGQIQKRVHEESVREAAVVQFRDYQDKVKKTQGGNAYKGTAIGEASEQAKVTQKTEIEEQGKLSGTLNRATEELRSAQRRLAAAQNSPSSKYKAGRISRAAGQVSRAQTNVTNAQNAFDSRKETFKHAGDEVVRTETEIRKLEKDAEDNKQRIMNWIKYLRHSNPTLLGAKIVEKDPPPDQKPLDFEDKDYDFFERMTLIDDLYSGLPPKWKGADKAEVEEIKKEFAFGDTSDEVRRDIDAASFRRQWLGLLIITFIFPLSVIAMKLLMSVDEGLMNYYSYDAQMQNSDYAIRLYNDTERIEPEENGHGDGHRIGFND